MVRATTVSAVANTKASSAFRPSISRRTGSVGSFRAGSPPPVLRAATTTGATGARGRIVPRRLSTQHHYHTFPTPPPKNRGRRPSSGSDIASSGSPDHDGEEQHHVTTPLPINQLALLALLSLAEQSALNSISPYLPEMIASLADVKEDQVGLYVGLLASAFALAQLATNLIWGYLADLVGRKPVMLLGTSLLCICFAAFGFCSRYWHIILVHVAMGLLNGNAAVVPTCLGELTDRSNQSRAFTWLPVVYSLGSITGPALGGLLVGKFAKDKFPYLAPNILGASLLAISVVVLGIWFEETLEGDEQWRRSEWTQRFQWISRLLGRTKQNIRNKFSSRGLPGRNGDVFADGERDVDEYDEYNAREDSRLLAPEGDEEDGLDAKDPSDPKTWRQLLNRTTVVLLTTSLVFQLSNSSFNSLYPVFASGEAPTGRDLHADVIGVTLSVAGIVTVLFQLFLFPSLKSRVGNVGSYRGALLGFGLTMALMPFVGHQDSKPLFGIGDSKIWLYGELGFILIIKNICAVGGLSSVMLLITNSAPSHASLGTVNGIAQTLSAAGRSVGPFLSGGLYTLSTHVQPKGEALAWGLFAGIALAGWLGTYAIHGEGLESTDDGFEDEDEDEDEVDQDDSDGDFDRGHDRGEQHAGRNPSREGSGSV